MYSYKKIKPSLIKYKYETAFEYGKTRVTYGELHKKIIALSNALRRMNGNTALILLRNSPELILSAFAVSASGKNCVLADSRISVKNVHKLIREHNPSVVILPAAECSRLEDIFITNGCTAAVTAGQAADSNFPACFELYELLKQNDYNAFDDAEIQGITCSFYDFGQNADLAGISMIDVRDGVYADLAMYEKCGAQCTSELLYAGRKLCFTDEISPKYIKKKKIRFVITDRPENFENCRAEILVVKTDCLLKHVGGGMLYEKGLSEDMSEALGTNVKCRYENGKIQVTAVLPHGDDVEEFVSALRAVCKEHMHPFDAAVGVRVVKNA